MSGRLPLAIGAAAALYLATSPLLAEEAPRFVPLDLFLDTGSAPLAAFQIGIAVKQGDPEPPPA